MPQAYPAYHLLSPQAHGVEVQEVDLWLAPHPTNEAQQWSSLVFVSDERLLLLRYSAWSLLTNHDDVSASVHSMSHDYDLALV